jgi:hypothetical protein
VLVLQLALGVVGLDGAGHDVSHDGAHGPDTDHPDAKGIGGHLASVRALAAGVAFFGIAGEAARRVGAGMTLTVGVGLAAALVAAVAVAAATRALLGFDTDGVVRIGGAVGTTGTVYVPVPGARIGSGKVQLVVQGRLVEYAAVTPDTALATGDPVLVVDVAEPDTLVVVRAPEELRDA